MRITLDQSKRRPGGAGAGLPMGRSETGDGATIVAFSPRRVKNEARALSSLIDQAVTREERAAALAVHYTAEAAKHRAIRRQLERLIP